MMKNIAVIGAGLTGAAAAAKLVQQGYQVTVFDKGRVAGGRMSSKKTEHGYLDMGAQYFTARSDLFKQQVQLWLEAGCADIWACKTALLCNDEGVTSLVSSADAQLRFIGVPSMQSPVKSLLQAIPIVTECRIDRLSYQRQWTLYCANNQSYSNFDAVLITLPPVQAQQLLSQSQLPDLIATNSQLLEPCWAVAIQAEACSMGDAIFCQHPKLRFISHQQHKQGRTSCYILHFNASYSAEHLQARPEFWFEQAITIVRDELNIQHSIEPLVAHRWLYASQRDQAIAPGIMALPEQKLWIGGDWSFGGRVENAYLAGLNLAQALVETQHLAGELS